MPSSLRTRARVAAKALIGLFSEDSAKQAYGLLAGIFPGQAGTPPDRGTRERLAAFAQTPWLHAVADRIATAFASVEWQLYVLRSAGGRARGREDPRLGSLQKAANPGQRQKLMQAALEDGDLEQITDHPMLDVLDSANSYHTGWTMRKVWELHYELAGDAFLLKERNGLGGPSALWPIPPNWIMRTPTPDQRSYRVGFRGWHGEIPDTEFLWISNPNPEFPYGRGVGLAQVLGDEVETDEYAAKMCHDPETEALTRRGWIAGLELRPDDEIATWNEALGQIEYQRPIRITRAHYEGLLHHWRGTFIDARVTPTHRLWVHAGRGRGRGDRAPVWRFAESRELAAKPMATACWRDAGFYDGPRKVVEIPGVARITKRRAGSRGGGRPPIRGVGDPLRFDAVAFAPFLGYYVSEGSPDRAGVQLAQSDGPYVDAIRTALKIFPPSWVAERVCPPDAAHHKSAHKWFVHHLGLAEWLRTHVGEGAPNKRLPGEVFDWPFDAQSSLLTALVNGDGSWDPRTGSARYTSTSSKLIDDIQRLCVQVGWASRRSPGRCNGQSPLPIYGLGVQTRTRVRHILKRGLRPIPRGPQRMREESYSGPVWCVTVPNERFFTRRYGRVMLGGNTRQTFLNQARPDFLVFPKEGPGRQEWSDPEVTRLQESWRAEHQGFWRVAKPKFIRREVGVFEFAEQSFRNLQLVQLREFERDTIRQVPGLPPEILGIVEPGASRATIDRAAYMFARFTLVPRLEAFRSAMQERLAPEYDERLIVGYASPVEEDREFFLKGAQVAPWALTVDEWRTRFQGLPEKEHGAGRVHMVPFALTATPEEDLGAAPPEAAPGLPPGNGATHAGVLRDTLEHTLRDGRIGEDGPGREIRSWRRLAAQDARICAVAGDHEAERRILRALADDPDDLPALTRLAARLEPRLRREFLRAVEAVRGEVDLEALAQAVESGQVPEIELRARLAELQGRLVTIPPVLQQGFLLGAQAGAEDLARSGVSLRFDLVNPRAVEWVRARAAELVVEVTEETRQAVRSLVEQAFTEGRDARRTAREIRDVIGLTDRQAQAVQRFRERLAEEGVEDLTASLRAVRYAQAQLRLRSQTIARTEIMTASHAGQDALWTEARTRGLIDPARTRRIWIATEDDRLEPLCEALDGQEAEMQGPFSDGTMRPPRHVNCRCSLGLRFVKE